MHAPDLVITGRTVPHDDRQPPLDRIGLSIRYANEPPRQPALDQEARETGWIILVHILEQELLGKICLGTNPDR
jgi:hypothetical protein